MHERLFRAYVVRAKLIAVVEPDAQIPAERVTKPATEGGQRAVAGVRRDPVNRVNGAVIEEYQTLHIIQIRRILDQASQLERRGPQFIADEPAIIAVFQPFIVASHGIVAADAKLLAGKQ